LIMQGIAGHDPEKACCRKIDEVLSPVHRESGEWPEVYISMMYAVKLFIQDWTMQYTMREIEVGQPPHRVNRENGQVIDSRKH
jgi:hypothetical protein